MPSEIYVDKIMDQTGANSLFDQSGSNWVSGSGFPAGHIVGFASNTHTRTTHLAIGEVEYHWTDLFCNLETTSTSNKIVVQYLIPDVYNRNTNGASVHCGVRYNVGTGAFDNSASQQLGGKKFPAAYQCYQGSGVSSALTTVHITLVASVPTVNTLRLYPFFKGVNGGVEMFDNSGQSDLDEAYILAYEIKQ